MANNYRSYIKSAQGQPQTYNVHGVKPPEFLPGALHGQEASRQRVPMAEKKDVSYKIPPHYKFVVDYLVDQLTRNLMAEVQTGVLPVKQENHVTPPWRFEKIMDPQMGVALNAGAGWVVVHNFALPVKYRGVINVWGFDAADPTLVPDIQIRFRRAAVETLPFFNAFSGNYGTFQDPHHNVVCQLHPEETFTIEMQNTNAVLNTTVDSVVGGWRYIVSKDMDDGWRSALTG